MNRMLPRILVFGLLVLLAFACKKDDESELLTENNSVSVDTETGAAWPYSSYNYEFPDLPDHFRTNLVQSFINTPGNNQISNEGATLGRVLFYDKALSMNLTVACASCHSQETGFTDPLILSEGFEGGKTRRHSMALVNLAYYERGRFFWDERAETLEEQVLMPIQDMVEMGMDLPTLVDRLQGIEYYPPLFMAAFGSGEVSSDRVSKALAQFIRSMISANSKYDAGLAMTNDMNSNFGNFTQEENRGKALFRQNCGSCHQQAALGDQLSDVIFHISGPLNNGLDATSTTDLGFAEVTGNQNDEGKFKSSSLRNIAVQAPYMHDGRFATLRQVVDFYSDQVQNHPNLSPPLRPAVPIGGNPGQMNLSNAEKEALVAFMNTLTDTEFLTDPKFSDPFNN